MDRRTFLVATGAAAAAGTATSAVAEDRALNTFDVRPRPDARVLRARLSPLFSAPYFRDLAERFASRLIEISDGRMRIAFAEGRTGSAMRDGIWFGSADERAGDIPALAYFAGLPGDLGLSADMHRAWLMAAAGQLMWDDVASDAGFKPFMIGHTDNSAGGWAARELATIGDVHGASVSAAGLAGRVAERLGARTTVVAASELGAAFTGAKVVYAEPLVPFTAAAADGLADHGAIWIRDGLRPAGAVLAAAVDLRLWHSLSAADQAALCACAALTDTENAAAQRAHQTLVAPHIKAARRINATAFTDVIAAAVRHATRELVADTAGRNGDAAPIHQAYMAFRSAATGLPDPLAGAGSCT